MTQVDFYILSTNSNKSRLTFSCRIAEKAVQRRQHVFVNSASENDARQLDELLWTFSQGSFIPHLVVTAPPNTAPVEPVLIGIDDPDAEDDATANLGENWDVMINLAPSVPGFFSRYMRVVEVIDSDPGRRQQGRERYRYYKDRGYELKTHNI